MVWTDDLKNKITSKNNAEQERKRKYKEKFDALTPMVTKILHELGESLWGCTFYGRRKCKVYTESTVWILIERKEFNTDKEDTSSILHININPEMDRFVVGQTRTKDLSEQELKNTLIHYYGGE